MTKAFFPFPEYDDNWQGILDALPGAIDDSWHNDTCPKFIFTRREECSVVVFCEWKEPNRRETSDVPRFCVYEHNFEKGGYLADQPHATFETLEDLKGYLIQ